MQAPSPAADRSPRRWTLVGWRGRPLAIGTRSPRRSKRLHLGLAALNIRSARLRSSRSQSGQQRSDESGGALSAVSHDPRCGRASLAALVECLQATRASRPVRRSSHHSRTARRPFVMATHKFMKPRGQERVPAASPPATNPDLPRPRPGWPATSSADGTVVARNAAADRGAGGKSQDRTIHP